MADHTKMQESLNKSNVLCDVCHGNQKLSAVKSCLQCITSFCETHLENHKTAARLIKHKLINAVDNLEDYVCTKHEKPLELFCRDDRSFLCLICIEIGHKTHNTVPIEQESEDRRAQVEKTQAEVKMIIQDRMKKTEEIKSSVKTNENNSVKILTGLIHCIERCQSELLEVMEQKQKIAEKQAEELIKEVEQEITELKRRDTELEQLKHTEDHLHLLQTFSTVCGPPQVKSCSSNITVMNIDLNTETLNKALQSLQENIQMELKKFFEITAAYYPATQQYPTSVSATPVMMNPAQQQPPPPPQQAPPQQSGPVKQRERKQIRILDPNQGGRDITEEIMFGRRMTSTPTSLQTAGPEVEGPVQTSGESVPPVAAMIRAGSSVMEKKDVSATLSTQQGILTEVSNTRARNVQTEDKIYFNKSSTASPKRVEKNNKKGFGTDLSTLKRLYTVNVILDPKTAYPKLILSKDGKQVKHSGSWRDVPNNPERFDSSACVLGRDGFSGGKFYYEVEVGEKTEWDLGVARESIDRKGKVTVCPENGFWCIWLRNGDEYVANESCPVPLSLKDKPQKVGVFVDYEEGLVSFYNVGTKALIYSFTGQAFTEKIYPFFSPCNKRGDVNTKPLIIY
ncbi:E3 ubiquitin/ISG15 ligase TRIM25-like isoform X2 [Labeo rohita]|uniref:E3 ubiquitin/ISG15 ligase TRIM25-like isoform X2 n=1 Tax=Labeo rohita TaxID=84645 RepID=UPI0021E2BD25|nr:E3 ubiquitin/ISG15 ligase TRIM25-like isoform X2 [Labeo rohita]